MSKLDNPGVGIIGERCDPETGLPDPAENELDNFYNCAACGQSVDMRDLGQVFHHEDEGHEPIDADG